MAGTRRSISLTQVSLVSGLIALAFIGAGTGYFAWTMRDQTRARTLGDLSSAAYYLSEQAGRLFENTDLGLQRAAFAAGDGDWARIEASHALWRQLREIKDALPYVDDVRMRDLEGATRMSTRAFPHEGGEGGERADAGDFSSSSSSLMVGLPSFAGNGKATFVVARRLDDDGTHPFGTVSATVDTSYFTAYWSRSRLPKGVRIALYRVKDGRMLARMPADSPDVSTGEQFKSGATSGTFMFQEPGGERRLAAWQTVTDLPVAIRVTLPLDAVDRVWLERAMPYLLFSVVAGLCLVGMTMVTVAHARRDADDRKELKDEVKRRTADLSTLNRTGTALASELSSDRVTDVVVDAGVSLLGAEGGTFLPVGLVPDGEPEAEIEAAPEGESLGEATVDEAEPPPAILRVADLRTGDVPGVGSDPSARSYLSVRIVSRTGESHGDLVFWHSWADIFDMRHEEIAGALAAQAAVALDNARLYESATREIEARKATEERQHLLIRELHHRVKNTLATVQAVMGATARSTRDVEGFQEAFTGRISSLANTHTLLTEALWQTAPLGEMLGKELSPYRAGIGRVRLDGPEIQLPSDMAVPLGMAMHELVTNAAKYGSLSVPTGRVEVVWARSTTVEGPSLRLSWTETGGPEPEPPSRTGFGTKLIDRVLRVQLRAEVETSWEPTGLKVVIEVPLQPGRDSFPAVSAAAE